MRVAVEKYMFKNSSLSDGKKRRLNGCHGMGRRKRNIYSTLSDDQEYD
jgi:hypothetical protein